MSVIRRVVTGNNAEGKSYIVSDETVRVGQLWRTDGEVPLGRVLGSELDNRFLPTTVAQIEPPAGASGFFFVPMPPWKTLQPVFEQGREAGFDREGFHRTGTLDYLYVLNGEIELVLDEGATLLRAGDAIVQRNTRHAWRNHTDEVVNLLATMVKLPA